MITIAIPETLVTAAILVGTFLSIGEFVLRLGQSWIDAAPDAVRHRDWWA